MSAETGFAVIGLGMGKHHCRAIHSAPQATLVAVCDITSVIFESGGPRSYSLICAEVIGATDAGLELFGRGFVGAELSRIGSITSKVMVCKRVPLQVDIRPQRTRCIWVG